ncbi:MAG: HAMP domain-containing histidine kinase [Candidatus Omnitrophica bacterium]|nr:HAMP domain-containing histidine kinase [Candidatus Omnitrophota bacterium]
MKNPQRIGPKDLFKFDLFGLVHELKSPLAAIEGAIEVIKETNQTQKSKALYFGMIQNNVSRLKISVEILMETLKNANEKKGLNVRLSNLKEICLDEMEKYKPIVRAKGVSMVSDISDAASLFVHCDASRIKLVISNLLSNAVKFTEEGTIRLELSRTKKEVRVTVEDSGVGIPADSIPYVFDAFYQGIKGRSCGGTGIGLTIAKIWVQAHGGEIHAESIGEGKGSRFWFTIPSGSRREVE